MALTSCRLQPRVTRKQAVTKWTGIRTWTTAAADTKDILRHNGNRTPDLRSPSKNLKGSSRIGAEGRTDRRLFDQPSCEPHKMSTCTTQLLCTTFSSNTHETTRGVQTRPPPNALVSTLNIILPWSAIQTSEHFTTTYYVSYNCVLGRPICGIWSYIAMQHSLLRHVCAVTI